MKNQYVPRHARMPAGRSAHGIPDTTLKGHAGGPAATRILAITLAVASLGAGAAVLSGHGSAGHQQDGHARVTAIGTTFRPNVPWML